MLIWSTVFQFAIPSLGALRATLSLAGVLPQSIEESRQLIEGCQHIFEVSLPKFYADRLALVNQERVDDMRSVLLLLKEGLGQKRRFWHVNSTASGGGVAELLASLLPYVRAADIDVRWVVVKGESEFFRITKRMHNWLHGAPGDRGVLGAEQSEYYENLLHLVAEELIPHVSPSDVVILHDPQTAGLVPLLAAVDANVIWQCHVGHDSENCFVERVWDFLLPYVSKARLRVFSKGDYVPTSLSSLPHFVNPPTIDPVSPKNQPLCELSRHSILIDSGVLSGHSSRPPEFIRTDGSIGKVTSEVEFVSRGARPGIKTPLIAMVSRWDRLKDHSGLARAFKIAVARGIDPDVELLLVGPKADSVSDDPEGREVYEEVLATVDALPIDIAKRIHLLCIPMRDLEENAVIVNAIQRHAHIVVQKSLNEGFGLTVTEAMWKEKPVVASRVGGISSQIKHLESGWLVDDPKNLEGFAQALCSLLKNKTLALKIGVNAKVRVEKKFLHNRHLERYAEMLGRMAG